METGTFLMIGTFTLKNHESIDNLVKDSYT